MSEPEPHGHAFYGVWQLMLQFCSRQKPPREGWLTADGRKDGPRMPAAEWARMFRCSPSLIRRTFRALESVGFIKLLAGQREVPASQQNTGLDTGSDTNADTASDTKTDSSGDTVGISSSDDEGRKERRKEPPTAPQGGTETNCHKELSLEELKEWMSKLFGRERAWSYEELQLLSGIAPVEKNDRALLSWAYTLPRDNEGWALVRGKRASKPKQNLIGLLREFSSEIDKWRGVRTNGSLPEPEAPRIEDWTDDRRQVFREMFPDVPIARRFNLLAEDLQRQIDKEVRLGENEIPVEWVLALKQLYGPGVSIPRFKKDLAPSVREEIKAALTSKNAA
jgi:hypothetical protein